MVDAAEDTTQAPVPKRWGDEEDDTVEAPSASSSNSEEKAGLELMVEALTINDSNNKAVTDTPSEFASSFEDLKLSPDLLKGLYSELKFKKPSKLQGICLPIILNRPHKDLITQAYNGSGKTTCFVLGMLSRVDRILKAPQALCVCPTRELAIQNVEVLRKMGKYTGITSECAVPMDTKLYVPISKQPPISAQVVIGTPATIKKWMLNKKLDMTQIKILVFDEVDHMLAEDGFEDDSVRIKKYIERNSSHYQVLLFSATFNENVKKFVSRIVKDDNLLFVKKEEPSLEAEKLYTVRCPELKFKNNLTKVPISTDLLAKGFDQQQVNQVITGGIGATDDPQPTDPAPANQLGPRQVWARSIDPDGNPVIEVVTICDSHKLATFLTDKKIILEFNALLQPVGRSARIFSQMTKLIIRSGNYVRILDGFMNEVSWRSMENIWDELMVYFFLLPKFNLEVIKYNTFRLVESQLRNWRCRLEESLAIRRGETPMEVLKRVGPVMLNKYNITKYNISDLEKLLEIWCGKKNKVRSQNIGHSTNSQETLDRVLEAERAKHKKEINALLAENNVHLAQKMMAMLDTRFCLLKEMIQSSSAPNGASPPFAMVHSSVDSGSGSGHHEEDSSDD